VPRRLPVPLLLGMRLVARRPRRAVLGAAVLGTLLAVAGADHHPGPADRPPLARRDPASRSRLTCRLAAGRPYGLVMTCRGVIV
jgi:hypothetical protein